MKEATIPWAPGYVFYENGDIRGLRGWILNGQLSARYLKVCLYYGGRYHNHKVHRLICEAFHGTPPHGRKSDAAHKDGNRFNNAAGNLKWASRKENEADKKRHGRNPAGVRNGHAKLTEAQVMEMRMMRYNGASYLNLAARYSVCRGTARNVCLGITYAP
jgi:hypothetical protein